MTILYDYKDSLYINMTNKCPCACVFCIRDETDHVGNSDSLWLDHEPTVEEVKNEFEKFELNKEVYEVLIKATNYDRNKRYKRGRNNDR